MAEDTLPSLEEFDAKTNNAFTPEASELPSLAEFDAKTNNAFAPEKREPADHAAKVQDYLTQFREGQRPYPGQTGPNAGKVDLEGARYAMERTPLVSTNLALSEAQSMRQADTNIKSGQASEDDYKQIAETLWRAEEESKKGFGQKTLDLFTHIPGLAAEMAVTGGAGEAAAAGGRKLAERALVKMTEGWAKNRLLGTASRAGLGLGMAAANPQMVATEAAGRMTPQASLDQGQLNITPGEEPSAAFGKSFGSTAIQMGSMGMATGKLGGVEALVGAPIDMRVAEILQYAAGLRGDAGTSGDIAAGLQGDTDRLAKGVSHMGSEALAFGAFHALKHGAPEVQAKAQQMVQEWRLSNNPEFQARVKAFERLAAEDPGGNPLLDQQMGKAAAPQDALTPQRAQQILDQERESHGGGEGPQQDEMAQKGAQLLQENQAMTRGGGLSEDVLRKTREAPAAAPETAPEEAIPERQIADFRDIKRQQKAVQEQLRPGSTGPESIATPPDTVTPQDQAAWRDLTQKNPALREAQGYKELTSQEPTETPVTNEQATNAGGFRNTPPPTEPQSPFQARIDKIKARQAARLGMAPESPEAARTPPGASQEAPGRLGMSPEQATEALKAEQERLAGAGTPRPTKLGMRETEPGEAGWKGLKEAWDREAVKEQPTPEKVAPTPKEPIRTPRAEDTPADAVAQKLGLPPGVHAHPAQAEVSKYSAGWMLGDDAHHETYPEPQAKAPDLEAAARREPLALPPHPPEAEALVGKAWDLVSRLWPEAAARVTKIEVQDFGQNKSVRGAINPQGRLLLPAGREITPDYLWHELVHTEQRETGQNYKPARERSDAEHLEMEREAYARQGQMQKEGVFDKLQEQIRTAEVDKAWSPFAGMGEFGERAPIPAATIERLRQAVQAGDQRAVFRIQEALKDEKFGDEDIAAAWKEAGAKKAPGKGLGLGTPKDKQANTDYEENWHKQQLLQEMTDAARQDATSSGHTPAEVAEALRAGQEARIAEIRQSLTSGQEPEAIPGAAVGGPEAGGRGAPGERLGLARPAPAGEKLTDTERQRLLDDLEKEHNVDQLVKQLNMSIGQASRALKIPREEVAAIVRRLSGEQEPDQISNRAAELINAAELNPQERRILEGMARRESLREMGKALKVSHQTVANIIARNPKAGAIAEWITNEHLGEQADRQATLREAASRMEYADPEEFARANWREFGSPVTSEERARAAEDNGQKWSVALANAEIDRARIAEGKAPLMAEARRISNPEVWDKAMAALDMNDQAGADLVKDLTNKMRPVDVVEAALLLHRRIQIHNGHERAVLDTLGAIRNGSAADIEKARLRENNIANDRDILDDVINKAGTEVGRSLQFRQRLAREDFSLAGILQRIEAAKGDRLSEHEKTILVDLAKRIAAAQGEQTKTEAAYEQARQGVTDVSDQLNLPEAIAWRKAQEKLAWPMSEVKELEASYRRAQEPAFKRVGDWWLKLHIFGVISGPKTLGKLLTTSAGRIVTHPGYEGVGTVLSYLPVFKTLMGKTSHEGGMSLPAEGRALWATFTDGFVDAGQNMTRGMSVLDAMYGGKNEYGKLTTPDSPKFLRHMETLVDLVGRSHAAGKAPPVRGHYERSFFKGLEAAAARGEDAGSPAVILREGSAAYYKSLEIKFQEENKGVEGWNKWMNAMRGADRSYLSQSIGLLGRTLTPVVKIPTNIVSQTGQHLAGGPVGLVQTGMAWKAGFDSLSPREADQIAQRLKRGLPGAAAALMVYYAGSQYFGGFYRKDDDKRELKPNEAKIGDVTLPSWTQHSPFQMAMQFAATVRQIEDSVYGPKGHKQQHTLLEGALGAGIGLAEETPLVREMTQIDKAVDPKTRGRFFGEFAKSLIIPQFMDWAAKETDPAEVKRKPSGMADQIKMGVPGLREQVPFEEPKKSKLGMRR